MNKNNYPVNIINAKKKNIKKFLPSKNHVAISKYQNCDNKVYGSYKPISKILDK